MLEFKPETAEKYPSTIGPLTGIEPTSLRYQCTVLTTARAAFQLSVFYTYVHARKSLTSSN